jgi:ribosomal subunit interface protein
MGKNVTATQKVTGSTPEIVVHSRHLELSSRFREHVLEKMSRVDRFGVVIMSVDVEVDHEHNPRMADHAYTVELTCRGRGQVIRAEARAVDKWAALDLAYERLEERLRRAADRRHDRLHGKIRGSRPNKIASLPTSGSALDDVRRHEDADAQGGGSGIHANGDVNADANGDVNADVDADETDLPAGVVHRHGPVEVREKEHPSVPMTVAEAVDALELVGHDFYLFHDVDADAASVLYRRRGYQYGVIRLKTSGPSAT